MIHIRLGTVETSMRGRGTDAGVNGVGAWPHFLFSSLVYHFKEKCVLVLFVK